MGNLIFVIKKIGALWPYVGGFFEVLIGARPEPLWVLLSKVGVLYALEPIFTVMFVVNMNTIWENVMSSLRARIFSSILIRKVKLLALLFYLGTCLVTSLLRSFLEIQCCGFLICRWSFLTATR